MAAFRHPPSILYRMQNKEAHSVRRESAQSQQTKSQVGWCNSVKGTARCTQALHTCSRLCT